MTILKFLVAAVIAAAVGYGAHTAAPSVVDAVLGGTIGLVAFAVSLSLIGSIGNRSRTSGGGTRPTGALAPRAPKTGRSPASPPILHRGGPAKRLPDNKVTAPTPPKPTRIVSGNFEIAVDTVDGEPKVTLTVSGFSGSDWKKRVRPAIERVGSVKWDFPKNLQDGRRQMQGSVRGRNVDAAVGDIRTATAKFGG